jgi:hypothetical protein
MSHRYRFTSDLPLIFSSLSHSDDVTVARANPQLDADGVEYEPAEGSTVTLHPGDILATAEPIAHAWLTEVDEGGAPLTANHAAKPETAAAKKKREAAEAKAAKAASLAAEEQAAAKPADAPPSNAVAQTADDIHEGE